MIEELNEKYRQKGEYESIISQMEDVDTNIKQYREELDEIDQKIFTDDFEDTVKIRLISLMFFSLKFQKNCMVKHMLLNMKRRLIRNSRRCINFQLLMQI